MSTTPSENLQNAIDFLTERLKLASSLPTPSNDPLETIRKVVSSGQDVVYKPEIYRSDATQSQYQVGTQGHEAVITTSGSAHTGTITAPSRWTIYWRTNPTYLISLSTAGGGDLAGGEEEIWKEEVLSPTVSATLRKGSEVTQVPPRFLNQ